MSIALSLVVLITGGLLYQLLASLKQPPATRAPVQRTYNVEVFDVTAAHLREIICGFGTAEAEREVILAAQVAGEIVETHPRLKVGERMQAGETGTADSLQFSGDVLLRIDPRLYQERKLQAANRLLEIQVQCKQLEVEKRNTARLLKKAREDHDAYLQEYNRTSKLHQKGVVGDTALTQAQLELARYEDAIIQYQNQQDLFPTREEQLQRQREIHRNELQIATLDFQHTKVVPPFSGELNAVMVEQGQYVRPGEPLVQLTDVSEIVIPVALPLDDYAKIAGRVRAVQRGELPPDELPQVGLAENETAEVRWQGTVIRVAPQADRLTRTANVFVHVDNQKHDVPLLPGTFVHTRIDGPTLHGPSNNPHPSPTVIIPRDAVSEGKIFIADGHTARLRDIEIEQTLQSLVVVSAGVQPGDQVILTNLDILHDGATVRVQEHHTLRDELDALRTPLVRQISTDGH